MAGDGTPAGTGSRFGNAVVIVAGVSAISATLLTCFNMAAIQELPQAFATTLRGSHTFD
ncbi:hypothetical protein EG328_008884 [Venturia inaequalis]|uniref:Uncharacterized protein n=1 Tax=Venturia inaequalis TaxID=5025 RepID=A0A8H3VL78_VENIN|nr:hypothetical protein EG328_008884 [Venturia inaequalis]KAE9992297.1 hypothetical protein EG327_009462 [Venturia inaequalis]